MAKAVTKAMKVARLPYQLYGKRGGGRLPLNQMVEALEQSMVLSKSMPLSRQHSGSAKEMHLHQKIIAKSLLLTTTNVVPTLGGRVKASRIRQLISRQLQSAH